MRAHSHRTERVGQLVRAALSSALLHETHDEVLRDAIITEVVMTGDLRIAKIYYTSSKVQKDFDAAIKESMASLKKSVAEHVNLRYVPELRFYRDTHHEEVSRIYQLLEKVHEKPSHSDEV